MDTKPRKRKRKDPFLRFMGCYAICFLLVTCIIMSFLWIYLAHYERSQDAALVHNRIAEISKRSLKKQTKELIAGLDHTYQSKDEALDALYDLIHTDSSYSKNAEASSDDVVVYDLKANENVFGTITLQKKNKKDMFGFDSWSIVEESYDYSALVGEDVIQVPSGWTIEANHEIVSENYISNYEQRYSMLSAFYGDWNEMGLPYLIEYRIGNIIGHLNFTIQDPSGNIFKKEDLDEKHFLPTCEEGTRANIESFMNSFMPYYIQCLSNANHDAASNFIAISPMLTPNGNLYIRLYNAIEGQAWANSNGDQILDLIYNDCLSLGNGCYLVDFTYTLETIGLQGAVQSSFNARVLLQEYDGSYLAADIESY